MKKENFMNYSVYSRIFEAVYYFLMMNIYFAVTNILFLIVVGFVSFNSNHILIYALSLIPTGPALVALISCLNKYHKEKDLNVTKDFFTYYIQSFKKTITVWLFSLIILTIVILDYFFLMKTKYVIIFTPILFIIFNIVLSTAINYFTFLVKNRQSSIKDILRISFFFTFKKFYIGFVNNIVVLSILFITILKPLLSVIFLASIFVYLIYINNNNLYKTPIKEK
ncbi:DUF624 domain-containing protein [Clostridium estertheticum]|uniref:DUF624 domain-containing protein n=1 Tax=Clostridium estertheticum TaxID=238834 RepID=UPI001C0CE6EE|nr:DUF624 domain-containing protein [Clostridium estertheticum]MBU3201379.1 DUF624 domain-containing protein [Clostridium estertheticum]WAG66507.1 DUF624 domain-containing protein [Clostridium estertheticum]